MTKKYLSMFYFFLLIVFQGFSDDALSGRSTWELYSQALKERESGDIHKALELSTEALKKVKLLKNKLDYSMVFWNHLCITYLINPKPASDVKHHRTLYIIVKNSSISTVYDSMEKKSYPVKPPYSAVIKEKELADFKKEAAEFDLVCSALTGGMVIYEHDFMEVDSTQVDIILRHIYKNWFGKDIFIYSTHLETITPSLSPVIAEKYPAYDTFSIILPAVFKEKKNPGLGKKPAEVNLMEGGIAPEGLPVIPYLFYGDKRGLFINNIDTASSPQLLHEYFHMIESVMPTGYPPHAWLPGNDGPPGITCEFEYYQYIYESLVNKYSRILVHSNTYGNKRINDVQLRKKIIDYQKRYTTNALHEAYLLYKMGDEKSLLKALQIVPDYPFASAALGGLYRSQGKTYEAYELLLKKAELDPGNELRTMHLGWLFTFNTSMSGYALFYYNQLLPNYRNFHPDWQYYLMIGLIKGYLLLGNPDTAFSILNDNENSLLSGKGADSERVKEWDMLLGIACFDMGLKQLAHDYFSMYPDDPEAKKYLYIITTPQEEAETAFIEKLETITKPAAGTDPWKTYRALIDSGKEKKPDNRITLFRQASLLFPDQWEPWFWIGNVCKEEGRLYEALLSFKKMRDISSDPVVEGYFYLHTGLIYKDLMDITHAGEMLSRWVAMQDKAGKKVDPWYYNLLIDYYDIIIKDKDKAYDYAAKVLSIKKDPSDWYYTRAYIWCSENEYE